MVTRLHDKQNHPSLHKTETAQTDVVLSALETIKQLLHTKKTRVSGRHKCIIPARTHTNTCIPAGQLLREHVYVPWPGSASIGCRIRSTTKHQWRDNDLYASKTIQ